MNQNQKQELEGEFHFFGAAETITNRIAPRNVFPFFQCLKKDSRPYYLFYADRKKRIMKKFGKVKEWIGTCFWIMIRGWKDVKIQELTSVYLCFNCEKSKGKKKEKKVKAIKNKGRCMI